MRNMSAICLIISAIWWSMCPLTFTSWRICKHFVIYKLAVSVFYPSSLMTSPVFWKQRLFCAVSIIACLSECGHLKRPLITFISWHASTSEKGKYVILPIRISETMCWSPSLSNFRTFYRFCDVPFYGVLLNLATN